MPKLKTHSGAKKRFKITATGKVMHKQAYMSHMPELKSAKRKRGLRGTTAADVTNVAAVKRMLPYK